MKRGFSLLEVMVAAGVMGIITLAFIKMVDMQNSSSITAQTRFDENELYTIFERTIMSDKSCNYTLGGWCSSGSTFINVDRPECIVTGKQWNTGVMLGNHASQQDISDVKDVNRNTALIVGNDYGRVKLKKITIKTLDPATGGAPINGVGNVEFTITTERTNSKFVGSNTNSKSILAYVKRDPDGSIYKCYTAGFEDVIPRERVYIKINQDTSTPIVEGGITVGYKFTASCDTDDMMLGGDCIVQSGGDGQNLVFGDGDLIITGSPNCGGCPNNLPCDSACFDNHYEGYSCVYNHRVDYVIRKSDGTEQTIESGLLDIPAGSKIYKKYTPFSTVNGISFANMGARALCLDRY